jgi:hypothetical protein
MPALPNVFAAYEGKAWPFLYQATFYIPVIAGGTPSDPDIAESWLRAKVVGHDSEKYRLMVAEIMAERNIDMDAALKEVNTLRHLNGFKRDPAKGIYIEGRQVKAAFKEAISVAAAAPSITGQPEKLPLRGYGNTRKYVTSYAPEHIFIEGDGQDRVYLARAVHHDDGTITAGEPFHEPTEVRQSFPFNARIRQTGIQYTEICRDVVVTFAVKADHPFTEEEWAVIWLTGSKQGIGAQRSQGLGVYTPIGWEQLRGPQVTRSVHGRAADSRAKADADGAAGND